MINFPPSREEIMQDIAKLRGRIQRLEYLQAAQINKVSINFFVKTGNGPHQFNSLDQDIIPFSLSGELSLLIAGSVLELQRQLEALYEQL
jgi:hypothetical protein